MRRDGLQRWRDDPAGFIERHLFDPTSGRPFKLLPAERAFLRFAFKVGPNGKLLYPEQVYACPKKSGKTTFGAIVALTMVLLFGRRYSEALTIANSLEQAQGRVFQQIKRIIETSPSLADEAKITVDRITIAGATIQAIPSDAGSAAGSDQQISVFDELWAVDSERGHRLFDELVPPPTQPIACRLTVTYAGFTGESVLLEGLYKRGMKQPEVAPALRAGDGILMAWHHEPVAPWQDVAWVEEMRRSLRPYQFLRMIRNEWVTSESAFVEMEWYERCVDPEAGPLIAERGVPVYIGIDASVKRDSTAIVAVIWDAAARKVRVVSHRIFQPTANAPLDFEGTVEWTLLDFWKRYAVREVYYDPYQMAAVAQRLSGAGLPMKEYPQTVPNLTAMGTNLYGLIKGGGIVFYPDDAIRLAISRAIAIETPRGWKISKEKGSHKIDVVVALAMAALGAVENQSSNWFSGLTPEFLGRMMVMPATRQTFGNSPGRQMMLAAMQRGRSGSG